MSWDSNVYYSPEKYGLVPVGEVELYEPDYSFDILVLWQDKEGKFYGATDSGCSCPSPFESYNSLGSLNNFSGKAAVLRWLDAESTEHAAQEIAALKKKVRRL